MINLLLFGLSFPIGGALVGAVYALYFDHKTTLPKGSWRRLI